MKEYFIHAGNAEIQLSVLTDIEYYVHQYDNAQDFVKMGGFKQIVLPALNSTHPSIRSEAAFILGSSMQSNPTVQVAALEAGVLPKLLLLLSSDEDFSVKKRSLYAISSLVRHFPIAQMQLIDYGGFSVFRNLFEKSSFEYGKLHVKVVTLLQDLVMEQKLIESEKDSGADVSNLRLSKLVSELGFCKLIPELLVVTSHDKRDVRHDLSSAVNVDFPLRPEHDILEKVLNAMLILSDSCRSEFLKSREGGPKICRFLNFSKK